MQIRSTLNGGTAEVDDEFSAALIESGQWVPADAPIKKRRTRRTAAQIAADEAAAAQESDTEE